MAMGLTKREWQGIKNGPTISLSKADIAEIETYFKS